jgi:ATP-dependent RNA helicase RhlE
VTAIPAAQRGEDVIGIAQTGTGKTLAFGIPMLERLTGPKEIGLILLPTRELAVQVNEALLQIGADYGLRTALLIGGENIKNQITQLRNWPRIIIATPGRLIDHLNKKTISLADVKILILDEADRMLDMGFKPQINRILEEVNRDRQTMLFSATMPPEITRIANNYMKTPVRIEVAPSGSTVLNVTQEIFLLHKDDKLMMLKKLLKHFKGTVLIFTRTKYGAKRLTSTISRLGHSVAEIHSNRTLNQRLEALEGFKKGKYRVLVATDIASRGIDVTGIELVLNYDLPEAAEDYVHRIGRTARAGQKGVAVSFATPDQKKDIKAIERLIKKQLKVSELPPTSRHSR